MLGGSVEEDNAFVWLEVVVLLGVVIVWLCENENDG